MKFMKLQTVRVLAAGSIFAAAITITSLATTAPVSAQATATAQAYQVNLTQLNKSNASGTATVTVNGNNVTVQLNATGLSPNVAHAIHIHAGGQNVCAPAAADKDKDGFVSVSESNTYQGGLKIALTTSGDTSNASGLVLDRMPKADAKGNLSYNRTFAMPSGVKASDLQKSTVDIHGIASLYDNRSNYDGSKRSDVDGKLPFETTAPAACGVLSVTPVGGANTGAGSTNGIEQPGLLIGGGLAVLGGAAALLYSRRLASRNITNN